MLFNKILISITVLCIFYFARGLILPVFLSFLLYFLLYRIVDFLKNRLSIPRVLGSALLLFIFFTLFGFGLYYLIDQVKNVIVELPNVLEIIKHKLESVAKFLKLPNVVLDVFHDLNAAFYKNLHHWVISILNNTWEFFANLGLIAILLYFLLISEGLFLKKILLSLPIFKKQEKINSIIQKIEKDMANYLVTKTLINVSVAIIISLILFIFQLPNAILVGMLVGILEFIPFLGSIISIALIALVAIASLEELWQILLTLGLVFIIMNLEGNILTPYVIGKRFSLNKVAVILGIYIMGWMWGIIGPFLAVPLMIILKITLDNVNKENVYSELIKDK